MDAILQKFREKFIEEAHGLLDTLESDLLEIEKGSGGKELTASAFRAMHTLKGISSMYGFNFISEFTHHLESIWQDVRDGKLIFNKEIFEVTFHSVDHIRKLLTDEKLLDQFNKSNHEELLKRVTQISNIILKADIKIEEPQEVSTNNINSWHILLNITEKLLFRGISLKNIIGELATLGEFEISKLESLSDTDTDVWSIILTSQATEEEVKEVFIFIEDYCTVVNLVKDNILSKSYQNKFLHESNEKKVSILDSIEVLHSSENKPSTNHELIKNTEVSNSSHQTSKRISVDASKLDQLMFLVSELITVNSQLTLSARNELVEKMKPNLEKVDSLSKQFRNIAIELRLVPLSDTVLRFQRLIRDLSIQLGKKVEFKTYGIDTELDKNTIDQLTEPLMHIIRNCIDHGIETPVKRVESGKPEQGGIALTAYNSGNFVFICISDDGNGIDIEKVKQKAIDKGIIKPTDKPEKKDILDLIFLPGFSTAQSLTSVSGRGVGMDVVKKHIIDLRGEVLVSSDTGIGTTFTLKIPQSLSIIDTLLFTVEENYFTVPISEIEVCMQLSANQINERKYTATLPYNDHLIPYIDLRYLLKIDGSYNSMTKVIIIKNEDKELALIADKIIGEHQAVLKPLGKSLRDQQYITSASQLGDGNMALMIDTNTLFKNINKQTIKKV